MSLANYQYDALMRTYNQKQLDNKHIADRRHEEICQKIPAFAALVQKEADLTLHFGELMINGDPAASEELSDALDKISIEKNNLLVRNGYPEEYLEIPYSCPNCHDTGYIDDFTPCSCFKKAAVALLYDQAAKQDIYKKENFKTFSLKYYSETQIDEISGKNMRNQAADAYQVCKRFAANIDSSRENLLIYGPTGVGKTFLANCIAKFLIDTIHSVIHLDAPAFFKKLADFHFHNNSENDTSGLYDCDCLIIDDLGAELTNSFVVSSLCECIEHRRLSGKATVFTTNLGPSEIKSLYMDRIFSRLISDYTFLHLDGDDIRLLIKTNTLHNETK